MRHRRCFGSAMSAFAAGLALWPCVVTAASDPQPAQNPASHKNSITAAEDEATFQIDVLATKPLERGELMRGLQRLVEHRSIVIPAYRFENDLCLSVAGLETGQREAFKQRIWRNASDAGLRVGGKKCQTNAYVMVVDQPEVLFNRLMKRRRDLFGPLRFRDVTEDQLRRELREGRPAVAWSRLTMHNPDGAVIDELGVLQAQRPRPSRLAHPTSMAKLISVVIFDANQIDGIELTKIADYASLHLLASPRRTINFAGEDDLARIPTILSLFHVGPEAAPSDLTLFDRSYLRGVYDAQPNMLNNRLNFSVTRAYRKLADDLAITDQEASDKTTP